MYGRAVEFELVKACEKFIVEVVKVRLRSHGILLPCSLVTRVAR